MATNKITDDLSDKLRGMTDNGEFVRVVVALHANPTTNPVAGASRQENIQRQKQDFQSSLDAVAAVISQDGGKLLDSAWINRSVLAEVPASALSRITDLDAVASVDTPRAIQMD